MEAASLDRTVTFTVTLPHDRVASPRVLVQQPGGAVVTSDVVGDSADVAGRRLCPEPGFSRRELQVVALVAHGHSNAEIATLLLISAATVKFHLHRITTKLGARNRIEVAAWAWQVGVPRQH